MAKTAASPMVSDDAVKRATGRDWDEWCRVLDAVGAKDMSHAEIARIVHEKFDGGDWWSQMVTVGYERLRGIRVAHQRRAGDFEISKSKTIAAPIVQVFEAWKSPAKRRRWLADPEITISTATAPKSLRFAWIDGTTRAEAAFLAKGDKKTAVTVTHRKLANAKAAEKMKQYWADQLAALDDHLSRARV